MAEQAESRASREIRSRLARLLPGSFWFKVHGNPYQRGGISDNLGVWVGKFIAVEIKMLGNNNPTPRQQFFIDDVNRAGGIAFHYVYNPMFNYDTAAREIAQEIIARVRFKNRERTKDG